VLPGLAADRDRADRDLVILSAGPSDLHPGMAGFAIAKRDRQRQLFDR
jgi:hypothetical protein